MISAQNHDGDVKHRRYLLSFILAPVALILIVGGGKLLTLGGSPYYLAAGLLVGGSSYFAYRGDSRAIWVYVLLLIITALWSGWESGLDPWGMQARLLGPAILGIWVAWPWISRIPRAGLVAIAICLSLPVILVYYQAERFDAAQAAPLASAQSGTGEWTHYGSDSKGTRFSPLTQISASNASKLEQAWTYRTGKATIGMAFEATPLMVKDTLYLCTPDGVITALDPETGQRRWLFDPKANANSLTLCRGVAYYRVPNGSGACAERIIVGTNNARLVAVDARTGKPCQTFGRGGSVDLKYRMGEVRRGYYYITSAPTIVNGNIVVGGWVVDNQTVGEPSGVVRAFDAVSGAFVWAFDMDRPDMRGEPPEGQTYSRGTANSWAPMSGDEALGLVYVPTGVGTPDYWGAHRSAGSEKYGSSVIALDSRSGSVRWSFQTSHHDLWDYDVGSQPTLVDLPFGGKRIPALILPTKRGEIFLLDRRNGKPISKVEERPVPQGAAEGDFVSATQPFSVGMPSFGDANISERTMWGATPLDQLWCRIKFKEARYDGTMTPPSVNPTIGFPGYLGGIDWGSVAVDPERRLMVVNWSIIANYTRLVPRAQARGLSLSKDGAIHAGDPTPMFGTPFALLNGPFLSPIGLPCNQPPFGKIAVVDLDSRKISWQRSLGTSRDNGPFGVPTLLPLPMGVPNMGGSIITRSGLIFIGATQEKAIRAIDVNSGKIVWSHRLPTAAHATPMTYISPKSGRQFVVIAAGGSHPMGTSRSDAVVAFALPKAAD